MKQISKSALTCHAAEGRMTLQIPEMWIGSGPTDLVQLPDDWFCYLKRNRFAVGQESGYLHFTRAGYVANKAKLKRAFKATRGHTWKDFEQYVVQHFQEVYDANVKYEQVLCDKLKEIRKPV